jgi:peptidylprolyl isomerase/FKBP-type peptidyl-prolyl cis-trans isomerase FkpA
VAVSKTTVQRIVIGIIALTMTVGTLGAYFIVILQNKDTADQTQQNQSQPKYPNYPVDPTAFKVGGKVNELQKTDLTVGTGDEAKTGNNVKVHYKGTFAQTGQKFDSSYDSGEPVSFDLVSGKVIQGWVDGVPGMKVGGKRRLVIPSEMGYGAQGYPGSIPPNTDLVFEIELIGINKK